MPMSDPVDSTGPLMKGDDERTPGKLVTLRDVGHTSQRGTWENAEPLVQPQAQPAEPVEFR